MRRWGHGHSLGSGVLAGLLLSQHVWTIACLSFAAGAALVLSWRFLHRAGIKAGTVVDARVALAWERVKEVRARRRSHLDRSRATRAQLEREYRRGVIDGQS